MTRLDHLLTILAEECAETAKICSKALRFGLDDCEPGTIETNAARLRAEYGDLLAVYDLLAAEYPEMIRFPGSGDLAAKKAKVEKWLRYSVKVGRMPAPYPGGLPPHAGGTTVLEVRGPATGGANTEHRK